MRYAMPPPAALLVIATVTVAAEADTFVQVSDPTLISVLESLLLDNKTFTAVFGGATYANPATTDVMFTMFGAAILTPE